MNAGAPGFPVPDLGALRSEVHIWSANLDLPPDLDVLTKLLSPDERSRAASFHFAEHRRRFVAGRAILRAVLAGYLGVRPEAIAFAYGEWGKPGLRERVPLHFNLSHSENHFLLAISGRAVGVDIERLNAEIDFPGVAAQFFNLDEQAALVAVTGAERLRRFYRIWTKKEAVMKARGHGVGAEEERTGFLNKNCFVREIAAPPEYVAALATQGAAWPIKRWEEFDYSIFKT